MTYYYYTDELYHWGILGMKWGVRRYRNEDGTLTEAGKKRYQESPVYKKEPIKDKQTLKDYYNRSVPVVEGLFIKDEDDVKSLINAFNTKGIDTKTLQLRNIKGETMNKVYKLRGDNQYRPEFNIMVFDGLDDNSTRILKTSFGGVRWYDDVVDNNERNN